jgi:CubicO group peptidase (beta-lactamase class C family)
MTVFLELARSARTLPDAFGRNKLSRRHMGLGRALRQAVMAPMIALAALAVPTATAAQTVRPVFGEAVKAWAAQHRVKRAFVVVRRDGRTVYQAGFGGSDPNAPVHLASLSKAITAACIATLIRDGKLGFDTPVAAALAKFIATHEPVHDPRLAQVTVAQLLTHRAGFATGDDEDPATGRNLDRYLATNTSRAPPKPSLLAGTLRAKLARVPGADYAYGNAAYFVLGAIVEEASGRPYASYCRDAVLKLVGATGDLEPAWRVSAAMGGWRMRAQDYLRFLDLFAASDARLGTAAKAWMLDSTGKAVPFDATAWYGLGTLVRKAEHGTDVWHWGSWDYWPDKGERGTVRTSFAAYAARLADGTAWFVHAEPRVEEGAPRQALERALHEAHRAVSRRD